MNIKSLLLGSAAALVAVSGARAADAVVIPEPEAVEYVRVCDAAGAGYFYIPGGETCLKISGYVQYQIRTGYDDAGIFGDQNDGWNKATEGRLQFESWTDSEYGAVTTTIRMTSGFTSDNNQYNNNTFVVDRANLSIGGLNMGLNASFYDFSATGAADRYASGYAGNQIAYVANFGSGTFGVQLIDDATYDYTPDVIVKATYDAGDLGLVGALVYDATAEAIGARLNASYAGFTAGVTYSADDLFTSGSSYANLNNWVIAANYGFDATDKLNLNVGALYGFDDGTRAANWAVGVEAAYKLTDTFTVSARARVWEDDVWTARMRFKAEF